MDTLRLVKIPSHTDSLIEQIQKEVQKRGLSSVLDEKTQKPLFTHPPSKGDVVEAAIRVLKEKTGL